MELNTLITRITNLQQELAGYRPLKSDVQERLDRKFRLEFNYNSNHIEGNTLTYGETELFLIFDKTTGNHDGREYEEMRASDAALKMIQEYAADKERPLTEAFIKSLNELILVRPYWVDAITPAGQPTRRQIIPGGYKKQPNSVRLQNGEMFHYTSPEETPIQMGELVTWYRSETEKNELHPVALAALLHYKFVRIHPFDDGNGRISRLLMNYVLYANDLPPVVVKSADKKNYLFALNQADAGDINAFVEYIARHLVWSLELSIKAAKGESIEEQDDLEKEIEVWKKGVNSTKNSRPETVLNRLYFEQLRTLYQLFHEKISRFKDLFVEWKVETNVNNEISRSSRLSFLGNFDSYFNHEYELDYSPNGGLINNIYSLGSRITMQGLKASASDTNGVVVELNVTFNSEFYIINSKMKPRGDIEIVSKSYQESISSEERLAIVTRILQSTFDYIKSISAQS